MPMKVMTRGYMAWRNMRNRCLRSHNPQYASYGGRGITICPEWSSFKRFIADMGEPAPGLSLDRIDNDGPYSPENCRWATSTVQTRNRRNTVRLMYHGKLYVQRDLVDVIGISTITFMRGIKSLGWRAFRRRLYEWEAQGRQRNLLPVSLINAYR